MNLLFFYFSKNAKTIIFSNLPITQSYLQVCSLTFSVGHCSQSVPAVVMSVTLILATCLLLILIKFIFKLFQKPKGFPPGPPIIPIAGSLPFLKGIGVEKWVSPDVASYGPVTGLYSGSYPFIMINDWKLAKSLFLREEFAGRLR